MRLIPAFLVVLAACSSALEADPPEASTSLGELRSNADHIAFIDEAGNVALVGPDGTTTRLTSDASDQFVYQQPTWSPDGDRLAWTAIVATTEGPRSEVRIFTLPSQGETVSMPAPPFYFSWSPDGESLAALAPGTRSLDLWVVTPTQMDARVLAEGQPFYFAWSPDSTRLLSHVANERLAFLTLEGASELISSSSAGYQAPGWSAGGELAYVVDRDGSVAGAGVRAQGEPRRQLVLADEETRTLTVLDSFSGFASMSFSPDGSKLAYSITPPQEAAQVTSNLGPLHLADLGESSLEVEANPVVLYQWSPDGQKILYAVFEEVELRWKVFDGVSTQDFGPFVPTSRFLARYLPFWDQYSLSSSLWAPDGSAFSYAAHDGERDLIYIQPLTEEGPRQVATGSVAFWSP